jgi:VWFA-related protein
VHPRKNSWPALLVVLFLSALPCFARAGMHAGDQKSSTLKVYTRLVNVDVVVHDKNGNPVTGLTEKDFTILDGGYPEKIALFASADNRAPAKPPLTLQPDINTNLLDQHGGIPPSVTIILLDSLNTSLLAQSYARDEVFRFLRQIHPGDHIALYALGKNLRILHDFTTDASSLIAALSHYLPNKKDQEQALSNSVFAPVGGSPAEQQVIDQINSLISNSTETNAFIVREHNQDITALALTAIADHVAGIPDRKNLVWVAGNLPFCFCSPGWLSPDFSYRSPATSYPIQKILQRLQEANVAIYPVDAHGLMAYGGAMGGISTFMQNAAKLTGGLPFFNTNDIMGSIRKAVEDSQVSYLIGYYPDHDKWQGEFRKLKIKVDEPDLKARARSGYYAIPFAEVAQKPKDGRAVLGSLAWSPLDATGIDFAVRVKPVPSNAAREVAVTVRFDPHGIRFTSGEGKEAASLQYAIFELDDKGQILTGVDKPADISLPEADYQLGLKEGMGFSFIVPLFTHSTVMTIVPRDKVTGVAGSVRIPLAKYSAGDAQKR